MLSLCIQNIQIGARHRLKNGLFARGGIGTENTCETSRYITTPDSQIPSIRTVRQGAHTRPKEDRLSQPGRLTNYRPILMKRFRLTKGFRSDI